MPDPTWRDLLPHLRSLGFDLLEVREEDSVSLLGLGMMGLRWFKPWAVVAAATLDLPVYTADGTLSCLWLTVGKGDRQCVRQRILTAIREYTRTVV